MLLQYSYSIFPLGDSAITIDFGNKVDEEINKAVLDLFQTFKSKPLYGMIEAIPAYSSLSIYYDPSRFKKNILRGKTIQEYVIDETEIFLEQQTSIVVPESRIVKIPVCYDDEFGVDLNKVAKATGVDKNEIIQLHQERSYRVYMLGFLPGFSYMGKIDERIAMPRKAQPEAVVPGSVAIVGQQTGIYPLASPGGWHIIGRTPLKLFDPNTENLTLLNAGDTVTFHPITKEEFFNLLA